MNFGGGDAEENPEGVKVKKTRKEVFEEIMEKSKSYDDARKEMKTINLNMQKEMDDDHQDLLSLLVFKKNPKVDPAAANKALLEKMAAKKTENTTEKPKSKDGPKKKDDLK